MREEKISELKEKIGLFKVRDLKKLDTPNQFLKIIPYQITLENGKTFKREKITKKRKSGDAVIILPFLNKDEVIINIEPRVFTKSKVGIGLPAGYIEKGEIPEKAARRELLEETGYYAKTLIPLGGFYQDTGISSAYNRTFIAKDLMKIGGRTLDESEYIENMTVKFEELLELIELGYSKDGNVVITALKAKEYLRRKEYETKNRSRQNCKIY